MLDWKYGIEPLDRDPSPSDRLYKDIIDRCQARHAAWSPDALVKAAELAREIRLARGTVTRTLLRLVTEGVLASQRGKGYRVIGLAGPLIGGRSTLISVSEFCDSQKLECVSVLDHAGSRQQSLRDLARQSPAGAELSPPETVELGKALGVEADEQILVLRRARGFREMGAAVPLQWAILETLFLVARKLPHLENFIRNELQQAAAKKPLGNVSLHRWMRTNGIELERSEYSLTLAPLTSRDARTWESLHPKPHHRSRAMFIRLRAVTYGKGRGPLLFTRENLVPDMFDLAVTGFTFRRGVMLAKEHL